MPVVLFVCTGNTCRSAMAEGLARKIAGDRGWELEVFSAGLAAWPGAPATEEAIRAAAELGADIKEHRARHLESELVEKADLILTMTAAHKKAVMDRFPAAREKTFTLMEYVAEPSAEESPEEERGDIPDPVGGPLEVYRTCAARLKDLVERALDKFVQHKQDFMDL
ncbi:MAG: low molecular weight protein arginine phosphatase [Moorellaceae bacterium]